LGAAGVAALLGIERRAVAPMLPLQLFRSATFSGANALTLMLYAAFGGALFVLPFQLIRALGYAPTAAGAALLPLSIGLAAVSPAAARLADRFGPRLLLTAGPLLVAAGFAMLAATASDGRYWTGLFPGLATLALGMGLAVAPLTDVVLGAVDPAFDGAAAGVNSAVARVAGLLAVSLAGDDGRRDLRGRGRTLRAADDSTAAAARLTSRRLASVRRSAQRRGRKEIINHNVSVILGVRGRSSRLIAAQLEQQANWST
jgi:hypothetical protein